MNNLVPTIIAEHEQFAVRATYDSANGTTVSHIDFDAPCALVATQAGKLCALTCLINGDGFDVFDGLCDSHKRNLIWLIDDLVHEVLVIAEMASKFDSMPSKAEAEASHG